MPSSFYALSAAMIIACGLATQEASASPLTPAGLAQAPRGIIDARYVRERRAVRINRRGRICRIHTIKRWTRRGVVVRKVRRCF